MKKTEIKKVARFLEKLEPVPPFYIEALDRGGDYVLKTDAHPSILESYSRKAHELFRSENIGTKQEPMWLIS